MKTRQWNRISILQTVLKMAAESKTKSKFNGLTNQTVSCRGNTKERQLTICNKQRRRTKCKGIQRTWLGNGIKFNRGRFNNSYSLLDNSTTNTPGRSCSLTAKRKEKVRPAPERFLSLGSSESQQLTQEQHTAPALKLAHAIPCPSFILFHVTFQGIAGRKLSAAAGVVASNQACVQAR